MTGGTIMSYLVDLTYSIANCLSCFPGSPQLKINSRSFKILRLLGEGGFSYVYLVQDTSTAQLYALKKIRCPFGQESVSKALKEVEAYALFTPHPNIIHSIDHSIASDKGGDPGAKTVYILLPYYGRGNLQDMINANLVNHARFPQRRLMVLVLGVCKALKAMHQYRVRDESGGGGGSGIKAAKKVRREAQRADVEREREMDSAFDLDLDLTSSDEEAGLGLSPDAAANRANSSRRVQRAPKGKQKGRAEGRPRPSPTDERRASDTEAEPLISEDAIAGSQAGVASGGLRAYAHRDIKPGNIMIADDGQTPILMDLGSLAPAPTAVTSRSLALALQDEAAEHSTMPYRAPELFDVKTGSTIDAKVDVWSLGCTIYACLVGKSPFEARSEESGGSLTMCVLGGDWRFPDEAEPGASSRAASGASARAASGAASGTASAALGISPAVRQVVRRCLRVEPAERPDVDELIGLVERAIEALPAEGDGDL